MTLATEGHANANYAQFATGGTLDVTTSGTDRILVLCIAYEQETSAASEISVSGVSSTSGYVWTLRKKYEVTLTFGETVLEIWWAYAPAQLTAEAVSFTLAKAGSQAVDGANASIRAVSGVTNFTNPWDSHSSLPATNDNIIGTDGTALPHIAGISTNSANCVVFAFTTTDGPGSDPSGLTADTGWTLTDNLYNPNPREYNYNIVQEKIFSSNLSSATVTFGGTSFNSNWIIIVDAITDAAAAGPSHPAAIFPGV